MSSEDEVIKIAKNGLKMELTVREVYLKLVKRFEKEAIAKKLKYFADAEKYHADFWKEFLKKRNVDSSGIVASNFRVKTLAFFYGLLGLGLTLKLLENGERTAIVRFSKLSKIANLPQDESKQVNMFLMEELAHEEEFLEYERRFRFFVDKIGTIFTQTSEGLVIVISTAIGLAGVYTNSFLIGIAGLMVGIASTLNTVVASYFFGRTEKQIKRDILKRIKLACECAPDVYQRRVEKYMRQKNYDEEIARSIAREAREKNMIERIIAEEEYGIREKTLGDTARTALYAGLFKIVGIILPLIPFIAGYPISIAIPFSMIITLSVLSIAGSIAAIAAEVDVKRKVIELATAGLVLSLVTFLIGKLASFLTSII